MKFKKLLVTLTALLLCTTMAWAQTTSAAGNWNTSGNWTGGVPASNGTVTVNHDMVVDGNITVSGTSSPYGVYTINQNVTDAIGGTLYTLTVTNSGYNAARALFDVTAGTTQFEGAVSVSHGTIRVRNGATLIIGALTLTNNSKITVDAGGTLIVNGALTDNIAGTSGITVNGYLQINGSYTSANSASQAGLRVTGSGEMYTQNSINTLFGSAAIFTAGVTNNAAGTFNSGRALACGSGGTAYTAVISPGFSQLINSPADFAQLTFSSSGTETNLQWQVSTTGPGSGFSDISGATSASYTPPTGQTVNKWFRMKYQITGCSGSPTLYSYPVETLVVSHTNTWTGTVSTAWSENRNWSMGYAPNALSDVVIASGTTYAPSLSTAPTIRSLTVNSGATLTISGSPYITFEGGAGLVNNGTISGTLKVEFVGGTQSLSGSTLTTFHNLNVTNATVTLNSDTDIVTEILLTGSSSVLDVDGSSNDKICKLLSTGDRPDVTASVAKIPSGASITGNITFQRYMSPGRIYKYISSPIVGATFQQWQDDFAITGAFTGKDLLNPENGLATICGLTITSGSPSSAFAYSETTTGLSDAGYYQVPGSINTETILNNIGYSVFIRDCTNPKVIDLTGPLVQGDVVIPITNTNGGTGNAVRDEGWNLIPNPYASAIEWSTVGVDDLDATTGIVYVRDNFDAGQEDFAVYNILTGVGVNGGSKYIAPGQAFWVQANSDNGYGSFSLTITESAKSTADDEIYNFVSNPSIDNGLMYASLGSEIYFSMPAVTISTDDILRVSLSKTSDPTFASETVVHFDGSATNGYDKFYDAICFDGRTNASPIPFGVSSSVSGVEYAIQAYASSTMISSNYSLNTFAPAASTALTLDFSGMDTFDDNVGLKLIDNVTSTTTSIDEFNPTYAFTSVSDQSTPRFTLDFVTAHTITSISPTTGLVGSSVVITGTGFSTTPSDQTVEFWNGASYTTATITASTTTTLTVTVPSGAASGGIRVWKDGFLRVSVDQFSIASLTVNYKCAATPSGTANIYYKINSGSWVLGGSTSSTSCDDFVLTGLTVGDVVSFATEDASNDNAISMNPTGTCKGSLGTIYSENRAGTCSTGHYSVTIASGANTAAIRIQIIGGSFFACI